MKNTNTNAFRAMVFAYLCDSVYDYEGENTEQARAAYIAKRFESEYNYPDNMNGIAHRKNVLDKAWNLVALDTGKTLVEIRTYYPGSRCYACVWATGVKAGRVPGAGYARASDFAGGYGYCKRSASVAGALKKAGFEFSESISGRGEGAIRDALEAIARHNGIRSRFRIVESYA